LERRDFLNGLALAVPTAALSPRALLGLGDGDDAAYPPALTGLRGSHDGSWEVAHALRAGQAFPAEPGSDTGERYDLVVVGGGLSGLAAAWFFRERAGREARVLVLDNHDDFGGHAKRNELSAAGRTVLVNGGVLEIESASRYGADAARLLHALGVDAARGKAASAEAAAAYESRGLQSAVFFDKETFGADRLVVGRGHRPWPELLALAPLPEAARRDIARLYDPDVREDPLPGRSSAEKKTLLARTSYADYLRDLLKVHPLAVAFFQSDTHDIFALGIDAVPALYLWQMGYPGFQGLGLEPTPADTLRGEPGGQHGRQPQAGEPPIHFPDGNATLARLLVRALVPDAVPGSTFDDVTTARVAYGRLDREGSPCRVRLRSTVVRVGHLGEAAASGEVEVAYVAAGKVRTVRASRCVLACWNAVVPYICPSLPEAQRRALAYGVKAPIVYTNALLRNWTAFDRLKVGSVTAPAGYHSTFFLAEPSHGGDYRAPRSPEEPNVVQMVRTPCRPGLPKKDQHRAGREDLLATSFAVFEARVKDQLARTLAAGGFDPDRDLVALTVNRWPHGYAYTYNTLFDPPEWALTDTAERPCVKARQPFHRITIANSDAAASPHTDAAFREAARAVRELPG
jgi:spermidine dehydrogenase